MLNVKRENMHIGGNVFWLYFLLKELMFECKKKGTTRF